jgi:hypothetical protein
MPIAGFTSKKGGLTSSSGLTVTLRRAGPGWDNRSFTAGGYDELDALDFLQQR